MHTGKSCQTLSVTFCSIQTHLTSVSQSWQCQNTIYAVVLSELNEADNGRVCSCSAVFTDMFTVIIMGSKTLR